MSETFVVVGGGLAAGNAVTELRSAGFTGQIVLFGEEHHLPYERPPLSKAYLLGNDPFESALVHPPDWYDEQNVDLRLGEPVTALDTAARTVTTTGGAQPYDRLLIATGATPRRLPAADESGAPVAYLRTVEDSTRLKETFAPGRQVAIIGAGWIGLEVAAAARDAGCEVTVLEAAELPLLRVLGPEVARVFADLHAKHGVDLRFGVSVTGVEKDGQRAVVRLADSSTVEADLLLVAIGVLPNTALAEAAGLATDNGIVVDARLAASAPDVFAAGDVANAWHPALGRWLRVEHWDTAIEQGKTVAHSMLGHEVSYDRMPYFFTDQYDLGMEYVGNVGPDGYDQVLVRGSTADDVFTAFWLRGDLVLAGMHVNDWDAIDPIRELVGRRADVVRLGDVTVPLTELTET
jgi:3-phenylpropionate/trans-cinnamate dioxygenase ferredoxin reductase subunit